MREDRVDLRKFRDMLREDSAVYPMYRSLKKGNKYRTDEQMERAIRNNLRWAEKIDRIIVKEKNEGLRSWE